jgi:hypothetical protein
MTLTGWFNVMGSGVMVARLMVAMFCGAAALGEESPSPGIELWLHPMNRRGQIVQSDEKNLMYNTCY